MAGRASKAVVVSLMLSASMLTGCGGGGGLFASREVPLESHSAEEIFRRAEFELSSSKPDEAAVLFSEIERLYPYSEWGQTRADNAGIFPSSGTGTMKTPAQQRSRYIDFYPADEDAAYAQYLLALSYYDQIDEIGRDQGLTFQALQALRTVIERYPDSEYARSSILKFDLAFDHLAAKEMEIGRYYLRRKHYTSAINRFRVVVEEFQTTTHTAEALHRLVEAYLSLGLEAEAQTAGAILAHNFQATDWYQDTYRLLVERNLTLQAKGESWLRQVYRQMIKGQWI